MNHHHFTTISSSSSSSSSSQIPHPGFLLDKTTSTTPNKMTKRQEKKAKAKGALWTLSVAVSVPLSLTMAVIFLFGSGHRFRSLTTKPFWFPSLWFIHLASLGSSFLTGFAAWLFWADGGFHAHSDSLPLYIAQVFLSIVWDPLVLVIGATWLGLVFCLVHWGTLFACYRSFRRVNPFAKDLIKPCLAWVAYLSLVTYKLIFL